MHHQTLENLKTVAAVDRDKTRPAMTRSERLQRWAELLEQRPERRLATLHGTEYYAVRIRETMRSAGSPITVAFEDPVLRDEGLKDDSYGEAKRFFEISDWQLHEIVCYCHFGETVTAGSAARHVRSAIGSRRPGMVARLRNVIIG
ncbi:hypothetical protein [Nitratireductor luteus]|uniref:hypothetical protein n=1 Tax=Nitratireductor luteus TaxID=2976980 RepID=UPI002240CAEC|nr:hypothetical protein [Nitratireductor luteus]